MIFLNIQQVLPGIVSSQLIPCQQYLVIQIPFFAFYFPQLNINVVPIFPLWYLHSSQSLALAAYRELQLCYITMVKSK